MTFDEWREEFISYMVQAGVPQRQADKYRDEYARDIMHYYKCDESPAQACVEELML